MAGKSFDEQYDAMQMKVMEWRVRAIIGIISASTAKAFMVEAGMKPDQQHRSTMPLENAGESSLLRTWRTSCPPSDARKKGGAAPPKCPPKN